MTDVLSPGKTTMEIKAALGAISIEASEDLRMRKKIPPAREEGKGISASAIAERRCVKTIVLMRPICLDSDAATREEIAERMPVTKKRDPSEPVARENFW
jgi:hypothetical protein